MGESNDRSEQIKPTAASLMSLLTTNNNIRFLHLQKTKAANN